MTLLMTLILVVIAMALLFDFVNGWNDSANAIATIVATRVMSPGTAVVMAAVLNLAGAMVGTKVADTMSKLIHSGLASQQAVIIILVSGLLSAAIWTAWMTVLGMPISCSHGLVGGVVGAAVACSGTKMLVGGSIKTTLLAMLFAPLLGFFVAYFVYVAMIWLTVKWRPTTMNTWFGKLQVFSAGWMAFTHGTGDAQKVMGIITLALIVGGLQARPEAKEFQVQLWVKLICAGAISLGTAIGGWKVIKTLGHHLTKLGPPEGFAAETSAALVLSIAAYLGIPTSSTHTITGSILGIGATRGMSSVRWGLGEKIVLAWVFTLPSTIVMGGAIYWVIAKALGT